MAEHNVGPERLSTDELVNLMDEIAAGRGSGLTPVSLWVHGGLLSLCRTAGIRCKGSIRPEMGRSNYTICID